jgi:calcium-dependent protein kinase
MQQILSAIVYCHQHNICHRDLKPENLLLEEDNIDSNIKVIDFGTSKWFNKNERMKEKYGTPYYIAPEVLRKDYNEKCDVWSCGIILYIMLSGYPPFGGKNNDQIMKKVLEGSFNFNRKEWNIISDKAKQLISKMLTYNAEQRISAEAALSDIWITQYAQQKSTTTTCTNPNEEVYQSIDMLRNFKLHQNLQAATLTFYASHLQSKTEEKRLRNLFKQFDKNGDGELSKEELIEGLAGHYDDIKKAEIEVNDMMERIDINHDGVVNYTEFIMAQLKNIDIVSNDKLQAAFNAFDLVI